jgi:hypothetical protein
MNTLKTVLILLLSLQLIACSNQNTPTKNMEEEKEILKEEPKREQEKVEENKKLSMQELLQGDWKAKEGMGFMSFKDNIVDMSPMGEYTFSIDEETQIITFSPMTDDAVAHTNKIIKLTSTELILDDSGDGTGQYEEYVKEN